MYREIIKMERAPEISKKELDEIHAIAVTLTTREREEREKSNGERWFERAAEHLAKNSIAMLGALLVLLLFSWFWEKESVRDAALVMGVLVAGFLLAACFVVIGGAAPFFNQLRKQPYSPLLWSIEASIAADSEEFQKLLSCRRDAIALYLLQYKHERDSFERRGAMIAGSLDKIGLFPAMAAFVGVATSLWSHSELFVRVLVFVVPAFYLMNFVNWKLIQEMNRTIAVLEYSIELHDSLK
ncbi:hypothetical protein [Paraburkholderia sp. CNPSo 3076]|uniref:hypothetical protein n=1 Tax=Paraburkholderia sp. CNPSo 3076 TaxID=2940936 RepID=UPI002259F7C8|nr:hypothetical protein [Paraburkholderia sp. CNPSo 3076]